MEVGGWWYKINPGKSVRLDLKNKLKAQELGHSSSGRVPV
jgi:hypothetical protein